VLDLAATIHGFFQEVASGRIEIYNECSLQHELGIVLRSKYGAGGHKVQFERPVTFFGLSRAGFVKNEIDLSLFTSDQSERAAIELKFPRAGQYPEQMFKFCQDLVFLEQLVAAGFDEGFFVVAADDPLFYSGAQQVGIYGHFRGSVPIHGRITKPTGKRDETVDVCGSYVMKWQDARSVRYGCVRIDRVAGSNRLQPVVPPVSERRG
jgi:hypothetical protein